MVHMRKPLPLNNDGSIDIDSWIKTLELPYQDTHQIQEACHLTSITGADKLTDYGSTCLNQSLEMAEILSALHMDQESIAAAILYNPVEYTDLSITDIYEQFGKNIADLLTGIQQISQIGHTKQQGSLHHSNQIDNIRKMLLAIVRDVRVVVIKLAERLSMMRTIRDQDSYTRYQFAKETMEIYAPLANRLGLHSIKWELEDLAFYDLETNAYNEIAKNLSERRSDREHRVSQIVNQLNFELNKINIKANIYGRAKHIYSIQRKMLRKNVSFKEIYDAIAVRILVPTLEDCYTALSIAHELWQPIPEEFDDYISAPKPNGYQSIHTAVIGPDKINFEIQIRTFEMHEKAEQGIAAHWMYKEGKPQQSSYEEKITWLRNLLEWQKELTHDNNLPEKLEKNIFEDRVYVFTPAGDIIDLPANTTPLDFAYHIHTDIGHRCRGAKINNRLVPLTYQLKTGDRIEILTNKNGTPSRDWLIIHRGYLKTSSARAKVLQWFKQQDYSTHVTDGRDLLEREIKRLNLGKANWSDVAEKLKFQTADAMLAALGSGSLRLAQIINILHTEIEPKLPTKAQGPIIISKEIKEKAGIGYVSIMGVSNLLSKIAQCCKPVPGDPIIGYITQGQGITIHHRNCKNVIHAKNTLPERLIDVQWNETKQTQYPVDIQIISQNNTQIPRDITTTLANDKITIIQLKSNVDKKDHVLKTFLTIETDNLELLSRTLDRLNQIPGIVSVSRIRV